MRMVVVAVAVVLAGNGALASDPQLEGETLRKAIAGKTVHLETPVGAVPISYRFRTTGRSFVSLPRYLCRVVPAVARELRSSPECIATIASEPETLS